MAKIIPFNCFAINKAGDKRRMERVYFKAMMAVAPWWLLPFYPGCVPWAELRWAYSPQDD